MKKLKSNNGKIKLVTIAISVIVVGILIAVLLTFTAGSNDILKNASKAVDTNQNITQTENDSTTEDSNNNDTEAEQLLVLGVTDDTQSVISKYIKSTNNNDLMTELLNALVVCKKSEKTVSENLLNEVLKSSVDTAEYLNTIGATQEVQKQYIIDSLASMIAMKNSNMTESNIQVIHDTVNEFIKMNDNDVTGIGIALNIDAKGLQTGLVNGKVRYNEIVTTLTAGIASLTQ